MPVGAKSFSEALGWGRDVPQPEEGAEGEGLNTNVGDEGGFAPQLRSNAEAIEVDFEAVAKAGYRPGGTSASPSTPPPPSSARRGSTSSAKSDKSKRDSRRWSRSTRICAGSTRSSRSRTDSPRTTGKEWKMFTDALGKKIQIVGDDIFVTNPSILRKGIAKGWPNSVLIKLNQIGTVTETIEAIEMAKARGVDRRGVPSIRRDRGQHDRRPRRGALHRSDQDRLRLADRPDREVQPIAPDRGGTRPGGPVRRAGSVL